MWENGQYRVPGSRLRKARLILNKRRTNRWLHEKMKAMELDFSYQSNPSPSQGRSLRLRLLCENDSADRLIQIFVLVRHRATVPVPSGANIRCFRLAGLLRRYDRCDRLFPSHYVPGVEVEILYMIHFSMPCFSLAKAM